MQQRAPGCPPRPPMMRGTASHSPTPVNSGSRDSSPSPCVRCNTSMTMRARSPTPEGMRRVALMSSSSAKNVGVAAVFEDAGSDRVHLGLYNRARFSTSEPFRKVHEEHVLRSPNDSSCEVVQMAKTIDNANVNRQQINNFMLETRSRSPVTHPRQRAG